MNILLIQSSPNRDGLTAACAAAAVEGASRTGVEITDVRLNDLEVKCCAACGNGWGTCRTQHRCQVEDDYQALHAQAAQAQALILVTPVYWGQPSESAKALLDRLRRCEATREEKNALEDKPVLLVAAAGGSGGGTLTCLAELERWCRHVGAQPFDLLGVTRRNRAYMLAAIRAAAQALAEAE